MSSNPARIIVRQVRFLCHCQISRKFVFRYAEERPKRRSLPVGITRLLWRPTSLRPVVPFGRNFSPSWAKLFENVWAGKGLKNRYRNLTWIVLKSIGIKLQYLHSHLNIEFVQLYMCQVNRENEWYLKPLQIYFPAKYFIRIVFLGYILENFNPIDPSIKLWINVYLAHWLWLLTGLRPSWDRREELRLPELLGHHD